MDAGLAASLPLLPDFLSSRRASEEVDALCDVEVEEVSLVCCSNAARRVERVGGVVDVNVLVGRVASPDMVGDAGAVPPRDAAAPLALRPFRLFFFFPSPAVPLSTDSRVALITLSLRSGLGLLAG